MNEDDNGLSDEDRKRLKNSQESAERELERQAMGNETPDTEPKPFVPLSPRTKAILSLVSGEHGESEKEKAPEISNNDELQRYYNKLALERAQLDYEEQRQAILDERKRVLEARKQLAEAKSHMPLISFVTPAPIRRAGRITNKGLTLTGKALGKFGSAIDKAVKISQDVNKGKKSQEKKRKSFVIEVK